MREEELRKLRESLRTPQFGYKDFALRNIVERLSLIYGDQSTFMIDSKPDLGTTVRVTLPIEKLEVDGCVQRADCGG